MIAANISQSSGRKHWEIDAESIQNISSAEDADDIKGTVQQWLFRFGKDHYVLLGVKALLQDIFWLMDPILIPIANAYTQHQFSGMEDLLRNATTAEKASTYHQILDTWRADIAKSPEPHRSVCVSRFGQHAGHEIAAMQGDINLLTNLAFFFQPAEGSNVTTIDDDLGSHLIGPPAAVASRNSDLSQGYNAGSTNFTEIKAPAHVKGPWSFFGTLHDYRWEKVEQWALNMNDYETLRRIGIKTVMFRGGDHAQRLSNQELTMLQAVFTAVETAIPLVSAPYDAYIEEDISSITSPPPSEMNLSLADYDEELQDLKPDPNLLIIEHPTPHLIKGKPVQVGQAPQNLTLAQKRELAARYRQRRRPSDIQRRKRARLEAHERRVRAELASREASSAAVAGKAGVGERLLRAGVEKVGGWLYGGQRRRGGGVRKVKVVKGREPNVAVGVRAELKSPVMQKRVSEVVLSSDPESD